MPLPLPAQRSAERSPRAPAARKQEATSLRCGSFFFPPLFLNRETKRRREKKNTLLDQHQNSLSFFRKPNLSLPNHARLRPLCEPAPLQSRGLAVGVVLREDRQLDSRYGKERGKARSSFFSNCDRSLNLFFNLFFKTSSSLSSQLPPHPPHPHPSPPPPRTPQRSSASARETPSASWPTGR